MGIVKDISLNQMLWVSSLLFISGVLSLFLRLGIEKKLLVASIRTVLQLFLLGFILKWVFALKNPIVILGLITAMVFLAGYHAIARSNYHYRGALWAGSLSLGFSASITGLIATQIVLRIDPWYSPQYLIPLMGMILGNGLTGISLGIKEFLQAVAEQHQKMEDALFLGATTWEALLPFIRNSIALGHVPILNSMTVAGIVSLPGMITGQLIAGADPLIATKYQIVVMFMIAATISLGTTFFVLLTYKKLTNDWQQIDREKIFIRK